MISRAFIPCAPLRPFISHFTIQEAGGEAVYKVLPDTRLVIGFQYQGTISSLLQGSETFLTPYGITGMPETFRIFKTAAGTGSVLVFFKEAGAARFFKEPLNEFYGRSISLDNFIANSVLSALQDQLQEAGTDLARLRLVENFLISRLPFGSQDKLVSEALRHIIDSKGTMQIQQLAKQLYITKSPFEKRFRRIVGASPKKFASLVRFKHALALQHSSQSLTQLAYEAGYYDQAHFIRDFKAFTGDTPESYFSAKLR